MRCISRWSGLGVLALGLVVCAAGCTGSSSKSAEKRIIILTNGDSPFWDAGRAGLEAAAKDLKLSEKGLRAVMDVNDGTPQGQIDKLRQYASQSDIVGVGISATDAANASIVDALRKLKDKGVEIITIDSDLDRDRYRDERFAFVGTDNLVGGRELGTCAKHLRPDGGEFVTFVGRTGAQNAIERVQGFAEGAGDKFKNLDNMGDETDRTRARTNVRNAIGNHTGLNVLVGIWSYNAPAIVDVVRDLNRRKDFTIVVFDAEPLAITEMEKGFVDAMVVQNPFEMGYQGVRLLKALHEKDQATIDKILPKHGSPNGDIYDTGLKVVVPNKKSVLKEAMFGKSTEFLYLSAFKKWLDKYGLKGS